MASTNGRNGIMGEQRNGLTRKGPCRNHQCGKRVERASLRVEPELPRFSGQFHIWGLNTALVPDMLPPGMLTTRVTVVPSAYGPAPWMLLPVAVRAVGVTEMVQVAAWTPPPPPQPVSASSAKCLKRAGRYRET